MSRFIKHGGELYIMVDVKDLSREELEEAFTSVVDLDKRSKPDTVIPFASFPDLETLRFPPSKILGGHDGTNICDTVVYKDDNLIYTNGGMHPIHNREAVGEVDLSPFDNDDEEEECLYSNIPAPDRTKAMLLHCGCKGCSPFSM